MSFCKFRHFNLFSRIIAILITSYTLVSCANMASPSGGSYDLDAPKVVRSSPSFNALNVQNGKVQIVFNELIQLEKPNEKVIITPPQKNMPIIQAISNRISVELKDSLLPNTTYTIDFTDAVSDYNEGNPIDNFSFSFSTGDIIDSLVVSGKILSADNLEPVSGMYVGLHSDLSDTAFIKKPFARISRTNEQGTFSIRGIAPGEYRIYGLNDINRDYMYDNPTEALAFESTIIVPSVTEAMRSDTIFKKDLTVDSIQETAYTRFLPDNIMLRSFTSNFRKKYLAKHERPANNLLKLNFGSPTEEPTLAPINFSPKADWVLIERNAQKDTISYWITDSAISIQDTLSFEITYLKTDSLNKDVQYTDTLNFVNRGKKTKNPSPEKQGKEQKIVFLQINTNSTGTIDVYDKIKIEFEEPITDFDPQKVKLSVLVDTIYQQKSINIERDTINPRLYTISDKLDAGNSYKLEVDSAAFTSYSGKYNNKIDNSFQLKKLDDYGNLEIAIDGLTDGEKAFVELLNSSDQRVASATVKNREAIFPDVIPGKYYARIIIDENDNGEWDTGNYYLNKQPEMVYYYPKPLDIKAKWILELEEPWNIRELPLDKQKPLEITKNKPKEKDERRKKLEEEENAKNKKKNATSSPNTYTGNPIQGNGMMRQ